MLDALITALKTIIGLKKIANEDKKTALEIKRLEAEVRERKNLITPATFKDVARFDPKYRALLASIVKDELKRKKKRKRTKTKVKRRP